MDDRGAHKKAEKAVTQREAIRQLLDSLPWQDKQRIKKAGLKYQAARPLDIGALYAQVVAEMEAAKSGEPEREARRLDRLRKLNEEADRWK
jgi:hypothetical protein